MRIAALSFLFLFVPITSFGCGPAAKTATEKAKRDRTMAIEAVAITSIYRHWATRRLDDAISSAHQLTRAVDEQDLARARSAYGATLTAYESARPAGEQFPDLDRNIAASRSEVEASEWRGLRPLEVALFASSSWTRRRQLADALTVDLEDLRSRLRGLSLTGRAEVRAASHLLSDIEALDLTARSEQLSGLSRGVALARARGAAAIWRSVRPSVKSRREDLVMPVDRSLAHLQRSLARPEVPSANRDVEPAANALAETSVVFR